MKNIKNKKRNGVTLIELVIALAIMSIVTGLIFFFYFTNQKKISEIEIKSDLQYEAKTVLDNISKVAMESTDAKWNDSIMELCFNGVDGGDIVFKLNKDEHKIFFKKGETDFVLSNHFKNIEIEDSIDETNHEKIIKDKIKLKLILENKGITYEVEENYVFRNSHLK
ncbi:MAG: type II secretion system protein [Clostridium sp.]|nr:type II secretion system protein [Clostridium sp.]